MHHILKSHRHAVGFTMVELMVVVAIVGILGAVAIPSYKSSVRKSNRSAAKTALLDLAAREEKFYSLSGGAYSSTITDLYGSSTTLTFPLYAPLTGPAVYSIATPVIAAATTTAPITPAVFAITATTYGTTQTGDTTCASFTINSAGQQSSLDSKGNNSTSSCW